MNKLSIPDRVDAHTHLSPDRLNESPSLPNSIKIEITSKCNYNCKFCAVSQKLRNLGDMDPNFLYSLLDQVKSEGIKEVGLFLLGEPFIVKDLPIY